MDPAAGHIDGGVHRLAVRIWFEDTDLSGLVYHANYLRYMERGRSDLLACLGIDQRAVLAAGGGYWAVAELAIAYRRPARLGDALDVETRLIELAGASVRMGQRICRHGKLLTEATVRAAFLSAGGRPQRIPADWQARFAGFG